MSKVDFYVLGSGGEEARQMTACRITEKAWRQGHSVLLQTADAASAAHLDRLLWTFRESSFVPHEQWQPGAAPGAPVLIAHAPGSSDKVTLLVNLTDTVPARESLPARVAEIIAADETARQLGRQRFRQYRDYGLELVTHEL